MLAMESHENCMAYRNTDGIEVALIWNPDNREDEFEVRVVDHRRGDEFTLTLETGKQALHAFYHPFSTAQGCLKSGRVAA